jgi:hypothetical protein
MCLHDWATLRKSDLKKPKVREAPAAQYKLGWQAKGRLKHITTNEYGNKDLCYMIKRLNLEQTLVSKQFFFVLTDVARDFGSTATNC